MVAANAGGAWSPIGDVTTTMLWVGGKITAYNIIVKLIIPSLMCLIIPLIYRSFKLKGKIERPAAFDKDHKQTLSLKYQSIVFFSGIGMLILVPVFKTLTHLPPFMGIMLGLGMLWIITEIIHWDKEDEIKHQYSVMHALRKVDTPSILFFFEILLSISALQATGVLKHLAEWLTATLHNDNAIVITIGLLSSIIDNVPLVAASQGMYDLSLSYWSLFLGVPGILYGNLGKYIDHWFCSRSSCEGNGKNNIHLVSQKNKFVGLIGLFWWGHRIPIAGSIIYELIYINVLSFKLEKL